MDPAGGSRAERGRKAEDEALLRLLAAGLQLVERNYRSRYGEIDLIMRDGRTLVFVEVRLRASHAFGGAAASITPAKQRRILHAAQHYLSTLRQTDADCRIDCVLIDDGAVTWLKNAIAGD